MIANNPVAIAVLQCPNCSKEYDIQQVQSYATCCNQPLVTRFDDLNITKADILTNDDSMWRYRAFLPLFEDDNVVSLGEGWTKILSLTKLAQKHNINSLLLKDESTNPTGSFKARGISMAVSKAKELGINHCVIPTAGNAGGALAAYCAKADIGATVLMPAHTAETLKEECRLFGAELILVDGLIDACGKLARQLSTEKGYFDMSTLKEPYRLEGKKTIGLEIAEQLDWELPDVIIYPTGGGTGLIGMWKAFRELQAVGWLTGKLPRMVIVQTENCAPMMHHFHHRNIEDFKPRASLALGLAVPYPFATDLMLQVIEESKGTVRTVSEQDLLEGIKLVASEEGYLLSPEGSATYMAFRKLLNEQWIGEEENVMLFNTGSWYKYR
ncbi:threonine synthase [Segetibacter sp. 3557_3]|uniref:threonine synthase n=1 Tax=Segetibacter sp. 3557_3 TaxID=2547429 RepID=UPI001058C32F|nr:threonine synthase [Segetibacter sp. 3557_3]TDH27419.1 threonine synthase [Segetibacter sp. 3557_3]